MTVYIHTSTTLSNMCASGR